MAAASYVIAGAADDSKFAEVERLADILAASLPSITIVKIMKHPDDWPALRERIGEVIGVAEVPSPAVWTESGVFIGSAPQFRVHVARKYGVVGDLSTVELADVAKHNMSEALTAKRRDDVAKMQGGKRALLVIDVQNDFCRGGSLEVPSAGKVIPVINDLMKRAHWDLIVFSQDFHPADHVSFAANNPGAKEFETRDIPGVGEQVMWPAHCVQGSLGCEFHPYLDTHHPHRVVQKGTHREVDSYSAFGDAKGHSVERTPLADILREAGISDVYVCGLAYDFCVAFTALDARKEGLNCFLIEDAARGITPEGCAKARADMESAGVHMVDSATVPLGSDAGGGGHADIPTPAR